MNKSEIVSISMRLSSGNEDGMYIELHQNGGVKRKGAGGLPSVDIEGVSEITQFKYFDLLLDQLDSSIYKEGSEHSEECPNGALVFEVVFRGDTEVRHYYKIDFQSSFRSDTVGYLEQVLIEAAELTNRWYFDVMVRAKYKLTSNELPLHTLLSIPDSDEVIEQLFEAYLHQIKFNAREWSVEVLAKDKTFHNSEGTEYTIEVNDSEESCSLEFHEKK